jgi:DNA (cytosine-5)-methyltransferase 1
MWNWLNDMLTFGSLFSGIGGLDLGIERAGMQCKWQVEIDDYATKVLEKHWPDVPRWRDIADFIADAAECTDQRRKSQSVERQFPKGDGQSLAVDLICGGFPCQPVSVAGRRRGMADERWLWDAFREVVSILRPRYVLAENVPGLLSAADAMGRRGALFGGILRDLVQLGYDARWGVLPAAAFGAPHLRQRVFFVAYAASKRSNTRRTQCEGQQRIVAPVGRGESAADPNTTRLPRRERENSGGVRQDHRAQLIGDDWRSVEPTIRRGNSRLPHRVDRLRCLGNSVVPQVAEWIGQQIIELCNS